MNSPRLCAAVLAGGKAGRYGGRPKGLVERPDGRTIIENLLDAVSSCGIRETVLAGAGSSAYRCLGIPVLEDRRDSIGPLAGMERALEHFEGRFDAVLFLPCDLPGLGPAEVAALKAAFETGAARILTAAAPASRWHPLCSVVHIGMLTEIRSAADRGELGVGRLWRRLGARPVVFADEIPFFNVNTPRDMLAWAEAMKSKTARAAPGVSEPRA